MRHLESIEQRSFVAWANAMTWKYPALSRLFAVPNAGKRGKAHAGIMKAEGMKAGVPDLWLPQPVAPFHGLVMETKIAPNKPTKEQRSWIEYLHGAGYAVCVCYGFDGLKSATLSYLEGSFPAGDDPPVFR